MPEIERKFLVNEMPDLSNYSFEEIEQGYISSVSDMRIRKRGNRYYITLKSEGTLSRIEVETEINEMMYNRLLLLVRGRVIRKTRYQIPLGWDLIAEFDVYHDDLEGLCTVEIEFESEKQARDFVPPVWFGKDVTENKKYKNKNLARIKDVSSILNSSRQSRIRKRLKNILGGML